MDALEDFCIYLWRSLAAALATPPLRAKDTLQASSNSWLGKVCR